MMRRTYARGRPHLDDVGDAVRTYMPEGSAWHCEYSAGSLTIVCEAGWDAIDTSAVDAAVAAVVDESPTSQAKRELRQDRRLFALALLIGQYHNKTPAEVRADLDGILDGL